MSTDPNAQQYWHVRAKITGHDGLPIVGAVLELKNKTRGCRKEAKTGADGLCFIRNILAVNHETYDIKVSAENYLTGTGKIMFPPLALYVIELSRDPRVAVKELMVQAECLYLGGDYAGAILKYEEMLSFDLASAVAELGCGLCELGLGNHDAAQRHMEKAIALARATPDPKTETAALEYLGDLMVHRIDRDRALEYFLEALELGDDRSAALAVKVADIYSLQEKPAQALAYYRKALGLNPALETELAGKVRGLTAVADAGETPPAAESVAEPEDKEAAATKPAYEKKLQELLKMAAAYCQRLEKVAFHYYCIEDAVEVNWPERSFATKNTYRYDFQIVGGRRRVAEKRKLLLENGRKASGAKTLQRTIFQSHLKYYAPIDLLGAANQERYYYWLLKEESIAGVPCIVVGIEARAANPGKPPLEGEAAISTRDGSVLSIQVAQDSIEGIAERLQIAREQGFDNILIQDKHWFEKEMKGLRFPSRSEMREIYLLDRMKTLHYTVSYSYSAYTFFDVRISSIEIDKNGSKKKSDHGKK